MHPNHRTLSATLSISSVYRAQYAFATLKKFFCCTAIHREKHSYRLVRVLAAAAL